MHDMGLKLAQCFYILLEKPLGPTSKFGLPTIRRHKAIRKQIFLDPSGDTSGLTKPKRDKHQH